MASAEDYAAWIVSNQDKKGTPEFETVAQAYKAARAAPAPKAPENPTSLGNLAGAALEPNAALLTGMVAQPVAGLAGIGTGIAKFFGATDKEPADVVRKTASALTYSPKTTGGKNAMDVIGYLPEKLGEVAHSVGETAAEKTGSPAVGAVVDTILNVAPGAVGLKGTSTLSNGLESTSRSLMQSALKPTIKDLRQGKADRAITTMLDEGIAVSKGGQQKLADRVEGLNDEIGDALKNSRAKVSKAAVANRLQDLILENEKQATPAGDVKTITNAYDEFTQHPLIPGAEMPVQLAQDIKKGTYRRMAEKYGEMGSADTEAQKTIARGLKEEIASAVPEVGPLNARESDLLNAKKLVDRRVMASGNHNPLGIAHLSPSKLNLIAGLLDRSNLAKSLLARGLNPGDLALSDMTAAGTTAPQTFSDDVQKRQAIIAALMGGR